MARPSYDLVILAAGMGSRFGGLKQIEPVGPAGELIIEYSIFDALRAGFGRLVLVIRPDMEADFRAAVGRRLEAHIDVQYVFQETGTFSRGTSPDRRRMAARAKPWGTGHAVLVTRGAVRGPFAVVNADDFYGASGYLALAGHFAKAAATRPAYALVGYPLKQTLSEFGTVSRGLCATGRSGRLQRVTEITRIEKSGAGAKYTDASGATQLLTGEETVSMNFWGFTPAVFPQLEVLYAGFLDEKGADPQAEFYLPTAISRLNEQGQAEVTLLPSGDSWFGITHREDLAGSRQMLAALVAAGKYPSPLWG